MTVYRTVTASAKPPVVEGMSDKCKDILHHFVSDSQEARRVTEFYNRQYDIINSALTGISLKDVAILSEAQARQRQLSNDMTRLEVSAPDFEAASVCIEGAG